MGSENPASRVAFIALFLFAGGISGFGQNGRLKLHVSPKQAYVFLDGCAISEASKHPSLILSADDFVRLTDRNDLRKARPVEPAAEKASVGN